MKHAHAHSFTQIFANFGSIYCCETYVLVFLLGLSYGTDDQSLKDAFSSFGDVVEGEFHSEFVAV